MNQSQENKNLSLGMFQSHEQKIQATYNFQYLFRKKSNLYKKYKNQNKSINSNNNKKNNNNNNNNKQNNKNNDTSENNEKE